MTKVIEVKKIGDLSARLVREDGREFVELFVRLPAAKAEKVKKRGKARRKGRRRL